VVGVSILDHHDPQSWRFYYYGDDDNGDPLFSFWMTVDDTTGVCIYERNSGAGKWLSTDHDEEEYAAMRPTEELKDVLRAAVGPDSKGVDTSRVESLPNYEQYFFQVIHGTIEQKHKAPEELLAFLEEICGTELRIEAGD
jgi:hypothetical protein